MPVFTNEKPLTSPFARPDLRDRRKALGLRLIDVAAAAGMDHTTVAKIEQGVKDARPHPWPEASADRVRVVLAECERTGSLPVPLGRQRPHESRAAYLTNPKPCGVCGRPIPPRPYIPAGRTRRKIKTCGNQACVSAAISAANRGRKGDGRPRPGKPITRPTGRPDLRARRLAFGLTARAVGQAAGLSRCRVVQVEQGTYGPSSRAAARIVSALALLEAIHATSDSHV